MSKSHQMLRFCKVPQAFPKLRPPTERVTDFREIEQPPNQDSLAEQAARCSQCGIPMCSIGCPLTNNIPDWLRAASAGRMHEAYEVSSETNTFPEICGRICPQDRLCEGSCVIEKGFGAVTIGAVEKYITDHAWKQGWVTGPNPPTELPYRVAIIGSGPAGLAAADQLRRYGIQVEIFDRYDRGGGLMIYGIPNFKLDKEIVERRIRLLADSKVQFHFGVDVGKSLPFSQLQETFDAVLIATGVYKARKLQALGAVDRQQALPYLITSNRIGLGDIKSDDLNPEFHASGKDVVVIGGGDTAMDCVRTAVRQGANKVTCVYRRDEENMPGSKKEVNNAKNEGVDFRWLASPSGFHMQGRKILASFDRMRLGLVGRDGRRAIHETHEKAFDLEADLIIEALGFEPENLPTLFNCEDLELSRSGTVAIDWDTMATSLPGVYAAGDIVRGASLVVWAIYDGRQAAESIRGYLKRKEGGC